MSKIKKLADKFAQGQDWRVSGSTGKMTEQAAKALVQQLKAKYPGGNWEAAPMSDPKPIDKW